MFTSIFNSNRSTHEGEKPQDAVTSTPSLGAQKENPKELRSLDTLFSGDKALFNEWISVHRELARKKLLKPEHLIIYNLIRGLPATRGFTPITNSNKLANGCTPMQAYTNVARGIWLLSEHAFLGYEKLLLKQGATVNPRRYCFEGDGPLLDAFRGLQPKR